MFNIAGHFTHFKDNNHTFKFQLSPFLTKDKNNVPKIPSRVLGETPTFAAQGK